MLSGNIAVAKKQSDSRVQTRLSHMVYNLYVELFRELIDQAVSSYRPTVSLSP